MIIPSSGLDQPWWPDCNYASVPVSCAAPFCQSILISRQRIELGVFYPAAEILPVSRGKRDCCKSSRICNSQGGLYHCCANTDLLQTCLSRACDTCLTWLHEVRAEKLVFLCTYSPQAHVDPAWSYPWNGCSFPKCSPHMQPRLTGRPMTHKGNEWVEVGV